MLSKSSKCSELVQWLSLSAVTQIVQLAVVGLGHDSAAIVGLQYAEQWGRGLVPYRDFHPEYPPGALVLFYLPYIFSGNHLAHYRVASAVESAIFQLLTVALLWCVAKQLYSGSKARRWLVFVTFTAGSLCFSNLIHRRFDTVAAAFALAPFLWMSPWALSFLGAGIAIKLWPILLAPLALWRLWTLNKLRGVVLGAGAMCLGGVLLSLPALVTSGHHVIDFLAYHRDRGVQVESVWAFVIFTGRALGLTNAEVVWEYGADHVRGDWYSWIIPTSTWLLVGLVAAAYVSFLIRSRRNVPSTIELFWASVAILAGSLLSSKVFSPQFGLWILPFLCVVSATGNRRQCAVTTGLTIVFCLLTALIYKEFYVSICRSEPVGLAVAALRMLVLVAIYAIALMQWTPRRWSSRT